MPKGSAAGFISAENRFTRVEGALASDVGSHAEKLCLWDGRALFIGALPDLATHQQAAALVCVGLTRNFFLSRSGEQPKSCRSALIGPQIPHELNPAGGVCAFLFFDPDSPDFEHLLVSNHHHEGGFATPLAEESLLVDALSRVHAAADDAELSLALAAVDIGSKHERRPPVDDERILHVMRLLLDDPGDNIPIERLAGEVGISASRLAHLFKEQIGVPIRMFRTWYRLKSAVVNLRAGCSLTDAALRAGFYDSAHFTNTFRETFGLPPSVVFSPQRPLVWYVPD